MLASLLPEAERLLTGGRRADESGGGGQELMDEGDLYNRLARSIAPEIWGHDDVKKARRLIGTPRASCAQARLPGALSGSTSRHARAHS